MQTKTLKFDKTIKAWDEALPLGNGDLGCLIWNKSNKLRFSIDKAGIWDCSNPPKNQPEFNYANLKTLIKQGNQKEINKKYDDCYFKTTPTKLPTGKIILDLGVKDNVLSSLDMFCAEASLAIGDIKVHSFVHAENDFGLIKISKTDVKINVENPKFGRVKKRVFGKSFSGTVQSLKNIHYEKAELFNESVDDVKIKYFIQKTHDSYYGIVLASKVVCGETLIAYTASISHDKSFVNECKKQVMSALAVGYDEAIKEHYNWWEKSNVILPDKFIEKQYNFNAYLLASCSRKGKYPMPLQGVWTADNGGLPPWKGDYHHDLNSQMSYTSYLKANRIDEGESYIDFLINMSEAGRTFAKEFYGVEGLCLPSVMDIEGNALGGWCQYAMSPTNQLWLCNIMARHYYFTGKKQYLIDKIYPYMLSVGEFLMNILHEENGYYKLDLSTSPEIHDNKLSAWLKPNSTYDLSLMRAFCVDMIKISSELENGKVAKTWQERLEKFEIIPVNKDNVLMLSPNESLSESHRHHSHCMSIYPLRTMKYDCDENKKIIDSTIANLEKLGIGNWVGYSLGWMAQFYAIKGDGESALKMIETFFKYFCTDNGFHSNGDFRFKTKCNLKCRLFTLEANFIAMDAVLEMLVFSEDNVVKLLPAIPNDWSNLQFDNLRCYGGVLVSLKLVDDVITSLKFTAECDVSFTIVSECKTTKFEYCKNIEMKAGQTLEF